MSDVLVIIVNLQKMLLFPLVVVLFALSVVVVVGFCDCFLERRAVSILAASAAAAQILGSPPTIIRITTHRSRLM